MTSAYHNANLVSTESLALLLIYVTKNNTASITCPAQYQQADDTVQCHNNKYATYLTDIQINEYVWR